MLADKNRKVKVKAKQGSGGGGGEGPARAWYVTSESIKSFSGRRRQTEQASGVENTALDKTSTSTNGMFLQCIAKLSVLGALLFHSDSFLFPVNCVVY